MSLLYRLRCGGGGANKSKRFYSVVTYLLIVFTFFHIGGDQLQRLHNDNEVVQKFIIK